MLSSFITCTQGKIVSIVSLYLATEKQSLTGYPKNGSRHSTEAAGTVEVHHILAES